MTRPIPDPPDIEADAESGCGWEWDHTTRTTYEGPDGTQWECTECGAEGWEPAEPQSDDDVARATRVADKEN